MNSTVACRLVGTEEALAPQVPALMVSPNPARNWLRFSRPGEVRVFDQYGKVLFNGAVGDQIATHDWAAGIYFIQHEDQHGTSRNKIVIAP